MQHDLKAISRAILYEGCVLYPYRSSAFKNQRPGWGFGALLPPTFVAANSHERDYFASQILALAKEDAEVCVDVRFLQLSDNEKDDAPVERNIAFSGRLGDLHGEYILRTFAYPAAAIGEANVIGFAALGAEELMPEIFKLMLRVRNCSSLPQIETPDRDRALRQALLSAMAIITIEHSGEFVSLLDPPEQLRDAAAICRQTGVFPVLAGDPGERRAVIVSPIVLEDFPQIAAESAGDFFDSSEIDEMLTLRLLTLSESERQEIQSTSAGNKILSRTETLPPEMIRKLHGVFRSRGSSTGVEVREFEEFEPGEPVSTVEIAGAQLRKGDRVRLWPKKSADIFDLALRGRLATIESLERTLEGEVSVAVTVDDDPGQDLGALRQIGHRFFFRPDEIEPATSRT
jgi:hypothetical protein